LKQINHKVQKIPHFTKIPLRDNYLLRNLYMNHTPQKVDLKSYTAHLQTSQ